MDPAQTSNQSRIGVEGRGGSSSPGKIMQRSSFRNVFVGGLVAAGVAWYVFTHEPFASKMGSATSKAEAISRGGSKPPTVPGKDKVDDSPAPTSSTSPTSPAHSGAAAQGHSEGLKPKL